MDNVKLKRKQDVNEKLNVHITEFERNYEFEKNVVVVLLGWLGCKKKYMEKYAEVYHKYGISTISLLSNKFFYLRENSNQVQGVVDVLKKKCEDDSVVIMFHLFSDLGFRTYGQIMNVLKEEEDISKRVLSVVIDSAPPLNSIGLHARSYSALLGTQYLSKRWKIKLNRQFYYHWLFYPIFWIFSFIFFYCCCFIKKPKSVHDDVLMINASMKIPVLFVYSEKDFSCPPSEVELFVEKQKRVSKALIMTKKYKDTYHVSHMRKYPKDYWKTIQQFLKEATEFDLLKEYNVLFDDE